ncbi:Ser/Thr protein phosphatase superfamily [Aspergillus vadensis CBS 113365]|uniref:Calcineurin-like phosphoesterase domain-containing protein n=1 Tax=Aspergillus vadensis (strain CBS 113365 / IMI 142717 / IBT 24658) TaxID=1448311 RepID=A0A319B5Q9_ASPVC|nr:hypothetical protein BO88DRAFT_427293 [Aspergillus vadensis CBS 113365]PYH67144.1 hypothetical protein BO88DRAFT_427293 [Aspergillus vadensis CBS 113365]
MANIQLQVLSDLHLESLDAYDIFSIEPKAPFLALLGDIGYVKDEGFVPFLRRQLSIFQVVFMVLGNHEAYHSSRTETKSNLERFKEELDEASRRGEALGKFVLLDQTRYDISPTLTILGCTFFSYITEEQMESVSFGLNDFYHIRDCACCGYFLLNAEIDSISRLEPGRKAIILTHYCPSTHEEVVDPRHNNSKLSSGFMTDLLNEQCWQSEIVTLWAFGHTHFNCDFRDVTTGKRVMTNQRGYYFSQSTGFNAEKVVELKDT